MKTVLLIILLSCITSHSVAQRNHPIDNNEIAQLFDNFFTAIENKDEALFLSLFTETDVSWVGVISQTSQDMLVKNKPAFSQRPRVIFETPKKFIYDIAKNPNKMTES